MLKIGLVGLGKMGLSHLAIVGANPKAEISAACDSSGYLLSVLNKYTGVATYSDFNSMLTQEGLDAVIIATPSNIHADMVRMALDAGVNVFCEKPFCLDPDVSENLACVAEERGLITQVGYHNRFVGTFAEVKKLLDKGTVGSISHVLAEAYGPVVLKPKGSTWRSRPGEGGSCLYEYAAHPLNLMNWYFGEPVTVEGSVLGRVFSKETDDEVFSTLRWADGTSCHLSVNWSDESHRKMTTKVTIWGTKGKIYADRQECQVYLKDAPPQLEGYKVGWNVKYTTSLTGFVDYYLRGEEYTAQLDSFLSRVAAGEAGGENDFKSAAMTDRSLRAIMNDSLGSAAVLPKSFSSASQSRMRTTSNRAHAWAAGKVKSLRERWAR